jgi:hypothetical protein
MGLSPLPAELMPEDPPALRDALDRIELRHRTPLWFYVLREAFVHGKGQHLGAVGSRIVAETMVSFVRDDPSSYLNNRHDPAVTAQGIDCAGTTVRSISDILRLAEVL